MTLRRSSSSTRRCISAIISSSVCSGDELLITAFIRMLGEKLVSLKRLPNGYCGDHEGPDQCDICLERPWWDVEFVKVGVVRIGWRKRVIVLDWSKTGHTIDPDLITNVDLTKSETDIHAYGYASALEYLSMIIHIIRCQKRDALRAQENV